MPCSAKPVPTGISATSLAGGAANYCAVLTSGAIDCWGDNSYGEVGDGSNSGPVATPTSTGVSGTSVVTNGESVCAILTSGGVDCWGASFDGQLGDGSGSGPDTCSFDSLPCDPTPSPTGVSATSLVADYVGFCAILTSGGVDCWGDNTEGELGVGTTTGPDLCLTDATPCSTSPVSTGLTATDLASAGQSFCAVLDSGAVDCWGSGFDGSLGDGSTDNSDVPVPVVGIP